jgi:hypothetical protein
MHKYVKYSSNGVEDEVEYEYDFDEELHRIDLARRRPQPEPGEPRMKLRLVGTVKRLNVEHRTPNIQRPILMTLCFIYFKTSESR